MKRLALVLLATFSLVADASHHNWRVVEVFTNEDGTLQFIQMESERENETNLSCCLFTSSNTATGASISYAFPSDLAEDSLDKNLLLGTAGIEAAYGIRPDYIIPDNYLFPTNGGIQYNEPVLWDQLPTDGINSLNIVAGQQSIAPATLTNFDGQTVTLPVDNTPPVISITGDLTIASNSPVAASDTRITDIVDSVTCNDDFDDNPSLTIPLPDSFPIGETEVVATCVDDDGNEATSTFVFSVESFDDNDGDGIPDDQDTDDDNDGAPDSEDAFPNDPDETLDTDGDGIGNNADTDDDGDGVADSNDAFPLDPSEAIDTDGDGIGDNADTDDDGDGIPDSEEDEVPPVIIGTETLTVDATGRRTAVDLSGVTATDNRDGDVTVTADKTGPFESGNHVITWTAVDNAGNEAVAQQILEIRPIVLIQRQLIVAEGGSANIELALSGPAPRYPVVIETQVSGSAAATDYAGEISPLTIESGESGIVVLTAPADDVAEGDELLTITLVASPDAAIVPDSILTVTITESNVSPRGALAVSQSGERRSIVYRDAGAVMVMAEVSDSNPDQALNYDWSASSPELMSNEATASTISFDAAAVSAGNYTAAVTVSDGTASITLERQIMIEEVAPTLTDADTDGDGISDAAEGLADSDDDGIPDFRDDDNNPRFLPAAGEADIETGAGLRLRLGELALAVGNDQATIPGSAVPDIDAGFRLAASLNDFEIGGLPAGGARVWVVIPLDAEIPANAVYRKYSVATGWSTFVEDASNTLASATPMEGICPPPQDARWQAGLNTGDTCVRLWIDDGGPNDADEEQNGRILDPGGIAVVDLPPTLSVPGALTLEATSSEGANLNAAETFFDAASCTDEVDGAITVDVITTDNLRFGENAVEFVCTDSAANVVTATATITVQDTTAPAINIGTPLEIASAEPVPSTDTRVTAFVEAVTCTDAASSSPTLTNDIPASLPIGSTTITFECRDDADNVAISETSITVAEPKEIVEQSDRGAGCFIATATYGSPLDPHVEALRDFRDSALLWHAPGRHLVIFYYEHSPAVARVIENSEPLRAASRILLTPIVFGIAFPQESLALLMLLLLWFRARRYA